MLLLRCSREGRLRFVGSLGTGNCAPSCHLSRCSTAMLCNVPWLNEAPRGSHRTECLAAKVIAVRQSDGVNVKVETSVLSQLVLCCFSLDPATACIVPGE